MANSTQKLPPVEVSAERFNAKEYLIRDPKSIGRAVIINNDKWDKHENYFPERTGSEADKEKLKETLHGIGFSKEIEVINCKNKKYIEEKLRTIAHDPSYTTEADIFMCVILSYGGNGYFFDSEVRKLYLSDIMKIFNGVNCPGLILKPKIFIMQACDKADAIIRDQAEFGAAKKPGDIATLPQEADFLTYTSTVSGIFNWTEKGDTHFIDCICYYLKEENDINFIQLTTDVNACMDEYITDLIKVQKRDFELPLCRSQLTKKLILKKI